MINYNPQLHLIESFKYVVGWLTWHMIPLKKNCPFSAIFGRLFSNKSLDLCKGCRVKINGKIAWLLYVLHYGFMVSYKIKLHWNVRITNYTSRAIKTTFYRIWNFIWLEAATLWWKLLANCSSWTGLMVVTDSVKNSITALKNASEEAVCETVHTMRSSWT